MLLIVVVWRLSTPWRRPVAATPTAAAAAAVYLQTLRTRDPIWQHPSNSPLLPLPFAIHAGRHHNATASSKKLGSAMSHSARQNHLKRPAIITYDRPTRTASWQDISCISVCQDIVASFRYSIERDTREIAVSKILSTHFIYIFLGASHLLQPLPEKIAKNFTFWFICFRFPQQGKRSVDFLWRGGGLCLCVKVCTRDNCDFIELHFFSSTISALGRFNIHKLIHREQSEVFTFFVH